MPAAPGRDGLAVQIGRAVGVHGLGRGRFIEPRRVVGRIGAPAQRKAKVDRSGIPDPHFQRFSVAFHLLQLPWGVLLPVYGQRNRLDVAHEVDLAVGRSVITGIVVVVLRGLGVGGQGEQHAYN